MYFLNDFLRIDLSYNLLKQLPSFIIDNFSVYYDSIYRNYGIRVFNNPLDEQLIVAIKKGKMAVLAYYDNLKKGSVLLREAKLMILGEGNAGKTNLRNLLVSEPFNPDKSTTIGIKIDQCNIIKDEKSYRINIWDVGGQWIQQQVHKFFITDRCMYVIMLNARKEEQPNKWLDWVKTYAPNSKVVVVANWMDEHHTFQLRETILMEQYPFIVAFHYVSLYKGATDSDYLKPLQELRQSIENQLISLDSIEENVPQNYIALKNKIETDVFPVIPYLSFETFETYFKEFDISGDYHNLLEVYQRVGTIRYFEESFRYILNPEWLSAGVYKILTCERSRQLKGILTEKDFEIAPSN